MINLNQMYKSLKGDRISSLLEENKAIVDIFTSTQESLREVNTQIEQEVSTRNEKLKLLNAEIEALNAIQGDNTKVIDKISKIFE